MLEAACTRQAMPRHVHTLAFILPLIGGCVLLIPDIIWIHLS